MRFICTIYNYTIIISSPTLLAVPNTEIRSKNELSVVDILADLIIGTPLMFIAPKFSLKICNVQYYMDRSKENSIWCTWSYQGYTYILHKSLDTGVRMITSWLYT